VTDQSKHKEAASAGLVAPSDIAEMTGVSRAAVSNWKKRNDDFPEPVAGTTTKPLFDRVAVVEWLTSRGYQVARDHGEQRLWAELNELRNSFNSEQLADLALTVACARKLSVDSRTTPTPWDEIRQRASTDGILAFMIVGNRLEDDPNWRAITDGVVGRLPAKPGTIARIVNVIDEIALDDLGTVIDDVLARVATAQGRSGGQHGFVGSRVSQLLANMVSGGDGVLYDPACGIASVLTLAHDKNHRFSQLVGQDVDNSAVRIAQQRCLLNEAPAQITRADVLAKDPEPGLKADMIVLEPPFGLRWAGSRDLADPRWSFGIAPTSSSETAWLQHCIAHLAPHGLAFVVTPLGPLFRGGEKTIRTELVRRGCVDTVIALPAKMVPHTSIPLALWVLNAPGGRDAEGVLFVDGSNSADPEHEAPGWLSLGTREDRESDPPYAVVTDAELLAAEADLTPRRWTSPPIDPAEIGKRYHSASVRVEHLLDDLGKSPEWPDEPMPDPRVLSVRELVESEAVDMRAGRQASTREELEGVPVHTVTPDHVRRGQLPASLTPAAQSSQTAVARGEFTLPGDVLVTTTGGVSALVDTNGGHTFTSGVHRLRINRPDQCRPEYLAAVLPGRWNDKFKAGTSVQRIDVSKLEVPLVPISTQAWLVDATTTFEHLRRTAGRVAAASGDAIETALEVVRYGVDLTGSSWDIPPSDVEPWVSFDDQGDDEL
jgi:hypothetical protein